MHAPLVVENQAGLAANAFNAWGEQLDGHTTIERVLDWLRTRQPALAPEELIAQDEFSYDLLVPLDDSLYLSYDTS